MDEQGINPNSPLSLVLVSLICCSAITIIFQYLSRQKTKEAAEIPSSSYIEIPWAYGGGGILGHALSYKNDPPSFICDQEKTLKSPIFRVNLAGRQMIVIGSSPNLLRQIATLPSSVMSSEQAVADVGFERTLGKMNVFKGTAWHKQILKNEILSRNMFDEHFLPTLFVAIEKSLDKEIYKQKAKQQKKHHDDVVQFPDLFNLIRRCSTRTVLNQFVGLSDAFDGDDDDQAEDNLIEDIMSFQDSVEDATAKAAVMNELLAHILVLRPVEKRRIELEKKIAIYIDCAWDAATPKLGPWLRQFKDAHISSKEAATLLLGLFFAAPKNPSIGAAQAFCFLHEYGGGGGETIHGDCHTSDLEQACKEARQLCGEHLDRNQGRNISTKSLLEAKILRRYILETLRVTSHTIGAVRKACKDVTLQHEDGEHKYLIQKGETVAISHIAIHRNDEFWSPAGEIHHSNKKLSEGTVVTAGMFYPHRPEWNTTTSAPASTTTKRDRIGNPIDDYKFTTFSHGIHKCPGEQLALAMMQIFVALLLEKGIKIICNGTPESGYDIPKVSFERATLAQRCGKCPVEVKMSD